MYESIHYTITSPSHAEESMQFDTYADALAFALPLSETERVKITAKSGKWAILGDETYANGVLAYKSAGFDSFK